MCAQIRDIVDFARPASQPSDMTRSLTFRVDVPVTYAVMIMPTGPGRTCDAAERSLKNDPLRGLGIFTSTSPTGSTPSEAVTRSAPAALSGALPAARTQRGRDLGLDELLQRILHDHGQHVLQSLHPATGGEHVLYR